MLHSNTQPRKYSDSRGRRCSKRTEQQAGTVSLPTRGGVEPAAGPQSVLQDLVGGPCGLGPGEQ